MKKYCISGDKFCGGLCKKNLFLKMKKFCVKKMIFKNDDFLHPEGKKKEGAFRSFI